MAFSKSVPTSTYNRNTHTNLFFFFFTFFCGDGVSKHFLALHGDYMRVYQ